MSLDLKTLQQIRQEKKDEIRKIFPARSKCAALTEEEENECLIEWLTRKRQDIGNKIYSDHPFVAETIFDELLSELGGK